LCRSRGTSQSTNLIGAHLVRRYNGDNSSEWLVVDYSTTFVNNGITVVIDAVTSFGEARVNVGIAVIAIGVV